MTKHPKVFHPIERFFGKPLGGSFENMLSIQAANLVKVGGELRRDPFVHDFDPVSEAT